VEYEETRVSVYNIVLNNVVQRYETNIKPNAYCFYLNSTSFVTYAFNSNTLDINK